MWRLLARLQGGLLARLLRLSLTLTVVLVLVEPRVGHRHHLMRSAPSPVGVVIIYISTYSSDSKQHHPPSVLRPMPGSLASCAGPTILPSTGLSTTEVTRVTQHTCTMCDNILHFHVNTCHLSVVSYSVSVSCP